MELNEPLIRKAIDTIRAYPHLWNQTEWQAETECGTTYCFAGWLVHLGLGVANVWSDAVGAAYPHHVDRFFGDVSVGAVAAEIAGLDYDQAITLYYSGNYGVEEFAELVSEVTGIPNL